MYLWSVGGRAIISSDMTLDVSARYGSNEIDYVLANTINPSLGDTSTQTRFRNGDLTNTELQLQADFAYALSDAATLAFGLSYIDEEYEIGGGEPASYEAGPYSVQDPWGFCDDNPTDAGAAVIANGSTLDCADGSDPVYRVVGVGSNGFLGTLPRSRNL